MEGRPAGDPARRGGFSHPRQRLPAYVLDLWFQKKWRARKATGDTIIVRYADDFVAGCQRKADAEQFLHDLRERMSQFALELHPDKTRLVEFGRFAMADRRARGERRPETFDFLGFTHYCKKKRNGNFGLGRKPIAKRVTRTLKRVKAKLRERMHEDVHDTAQWLGRVVNGWLNYYAVPTSARALRGFARRLLWIWLRTLRGRSQKDRTTIAGVARLAALYWHPSPASLANRAICRQPPKVGAVCAARTYGSARGDRGNPPYRERERRRAGLETIDAEADSPN